jgi:peptidoglycan-associated lipoprotein
MRQYRRTFLFLTLTLLLALSTACRSKTVAKEEPKPAPPPPAPMVVEQPKTVEPPADFVPEQPVQTEDLSGDMDAINQRAQERGWIRDAFFDFDAYSLTTEAQDNLAISAAWLKAHPDFDLLIEGHCDERGTEQYNLALGDRRANTAKDYLVTLGVGSARVKTVSYGEERPFDPGHNESAWAKNRRAHLVLVRH